MENTEIMCAILDKIKSYDTVMLFRHIRCDGDAVGSTMGLREIIRATYPKKKVYLIDEDHSDYLDFLGDEDEDVSDDVYSNALGIVLDTATEDRISNQKYKMCREIIKIDHHIEVNKYGDISWVESGRSSTCEMIVKLYDCFSDELTLTAQAAKYLYTGLVTDSGRFRFNSVSGDTLRYAALLLDIGVEVDSLFANLYMQDFESFRFKSYVYGKIKISENGVAYVCVSRALQEKYALSREEASNSVNYLDSIKGSLIWMSFIENTDGDGSSGVRVRLRSRFVPINKLAEKYHGGGHAFACGATVYSKAEMRNLIREADELLKKYKEENEGWL